MNIGITVYLLSVNWYSRPEALTVFDRSDERLDHFSTDKVAVELVQLCQPEVIAGVVCVLGIVRVATQVTKELHQHKRAIEFLSVQNWVLSHVAQCAPARCRVARRGRG